MKRLCHSVFLNGADRPFQDWYPGRRNFIFSFLFNALFLVALFLYEVIFCNHSLFCVPGEGGCGKWKIGEDK